MPEVQIEATHDPLVIAVTIEHPLPEVALAVAAIMSAAVAAGVKAAAGCQDEAGSWSRYSA